jgi:hypothetical protein
MLPPGASESFRDPGTLWSAAEFANPRQNAAAAVTLILALPTDPEISKEDRTAMVREFVDQRLVSRGFAVQIDLHQTEFSSRHGHLLVLPRRVDGKVKPSPARYKELQKRGVEDSMAALAAKRNRSKRACRPRLRAAWLPENRLTFGVFASS